jgi:VanZ family protein
VHFVRSCYSSCFLILFGLENDGLIREILLNTLVLLVYAVLVAFVSLSPSSGASAEHWDKVLHLVTYAVFAAIGYGAIKEGRRYFFVCLGIIVYSGLIEVAQSYMPGRVMSGYDLLANAVGVVIGAGIMRHFNKPR